MRFLEFDESRLSAWAENIHFLSGRSRPGGCDQRVMGVQECLEGFDVRIDRADAKVVCELKCSANGGLGRGRGHAGG